MKADRIFRARAPLRLGLAGGGTDLSPYCDKYGGAVLNVTIDRFVFASLRLRSDDEIRFRAADLETADPTHRRVTVDDPVKVHQAVYDRLVDQFHGGRRFGVEVTTMSDVPPGSGLGSSSSLIVALVEVFRHALRLPLGRYDIARLAFDIERRDLALPGGRQDQYAAAFGGFNFIEFFSDERVIVNPLEVAHGIRHELEASLVLCFSAQSRMSERIIEQQINTASAAASPGLDGLHAMKAAAFDMKEAILQGDLVRVAELLNQTWESKKRTSDLVSTAALDDLLARAFAAGARAGKISGAGGGGFLMFIVDPEHRLGFMRALTAAGGHPTTMTFATRGVESWSHPI